MFGPWIQVYSWLKGSMPFASDLNKPHVNFISLHYAYLIGLSILCSVVIYPSKNIAYIDALLLSSGAATQSGLNPVDINQLHVYQQVFILFISMIANPIFIHSSVVFVRLYWFEKRFQRLVNDVRALRRNNSKTRSRSIGAEERTVGNQQRAVGGREITVLHDRGRSANDAGHTKEQDLELAQFNEKANEDAIKLLREGMVRSQDGETRLESPTLSRDVQFADDVQKNNRHQRRTSLPTFNETPLQENAEQHTAFDTGRSSPKYKTTLRIPGPLEYDRGHLPQQIIDKDGEDETAGAAEAVGRDDMDASRSTQRIASADNAENKAPDPSGGAPHASSIKKTYTGTSPVPGLRARSQTFRKAFSSTSAEAPPAPYISWHPTIGRNSTFVNLTEEQREELGGIEYRALKSLAGILIIYFIGYQILAILCFLPWIWRNKPHKDLLVSSSINPTWWGIFTPLSHFFDLGYTLTADSMISFNQTVFPLIAGSFFIVIGNTGFPCMLRFMIWVGTVLVKRGSPLWEEFRFLLDHPRRCFTLLFPGTGTWWLFWSLVILNGVDLIFYLLLDIHDSTVTSLPPGFRFLTGLYQAFSTRTAGFAVVNLAGLHPAVQVSYMVMMYISVFPVAISMRASNVYEEQSLGVYGSQDVGDNKGNDTNYIGIHFRRQLGFDLWYIFLGMFIIAIVESDRLQNTNEYSFTLFSVLFEIVSSYGTVGLSLGFPGVNTSFCSQFRTISKLVIVAMEIRGRHRGLPYALDRAILLPSASLLMRKDPSTLGRLRSRPSADDRNDPANVHDAPAAAIIDENVDVGHTKTRGLAGLLQRTFAAGPSHRLKAS